MVKRTSGFSLLEVVLAIGIVGTGVAAVVAWLAPLARAAGEAGDAERARALVEEVRQQLGQWYLAAEEGTAEARLQGVTEQAAAGALRWMVDRAGHRWQAAGAGAPPPGGAGERYFAVDVSPAEDAWAMPEESAVRVFRVRVVWPASAGTRARSREWRVTLLP